MSASSDFGCWKCIGCVFSIRLILADGDGEIRQVREKKILAQVKFLRPIPSRLC